MLWLDSIYPKDAAGKPGAARGPCSVDSGKPEDVRSKYPNSEVTFGSIKFGEIGSTVNGDIPDPDPHPDPDPTPKPDKGKHCCAFYMHHCDDLSETSWCNQSEQKCTKDCGGEWVVAPTNTLSILDE